MTTAMIPYTIPYTVGHPGLGGSAYVEQVGAAPSPREQLAHFDRLVRLHTTFWTKQSPSRALSAFLTHHWYPFIEQWWEIREYLETPLGLSQLRRRLEKHKRIVHVSPGVARFEPFPVPSDLLAAVLQEFARELSLLRETAVREGIPIPDLGTSRYGVYPDSGIPTPDLGTAQHGIVPAEKVLAPMIAQTQATSKVSGFQGETQMDDYAGWDAEVGSWWPFAAGLPAGALGGYFYRKWQEKNPGKIFPWQSAPKSVGAYPWYDIQDPGPPRFVQRGPWVDIVGQDADVGAWPWYSIEPDAPIVGGPWVDIVGAQAQQKTARRREWKKTQALIASAIAEVTDAYAMQPAPAYVWSLDPPAASPYARVELTGSTMVMPFASLDQAIAYMRERLSTPYVALAAFDSTSSRWPNPVRWSKSYDPSDEPVIAQQIAKHAPAQVSGGPWMDIVGDDASVGAGPWMDIVGEDAVGAMPWYDIVGSAAGDDPALRTLRILRKQAMIAAEEMPGRAVGVRRGADGKWQLKSFRSTDDADDWFGLAISEPGDFTYAAYFSKFRGVPFLEHEEVGRGRPSSRRRELASVTVKP